MYYVGTCLIVIGALLVGLFGVIPEPDHDIDDLIRLYKKPAFIAYFSILEFVILTGLLTSHYFERLYHQMESATLQPNNIGKFVGKWVSMQDLKKYIGISFGVLSGNISSQSILFAKSGLELILLTVVQHKNQLNHALTWILLVMMIVTAVLQVSYCYSPCFFFFCLISSFVVVLFKQRFAIYRHCYFSSPFVLYIQRIMFV